VAGEGGGEIVAQVAGVQQLSTAVAGVQRQATAVAGVQRLPAAGSGGEGASGSNWTWVGLTVLAAGTGLLLASWRLSKTS